MTIQSLDAISMTVAGQPVLVTLPPGATIDLPSVIDSAPTPMRWPDFYKTGFDTGIEYWGSSGACSAGNGVFASSGWSIDTNHLQAKGGPGAIYLLAFRNKQGWEYQKQDGSYVGCDFTNARIKMRVRGVNFNPNGSEWIVWIQARHPSIPNKFINWGYVGAPLTAKLLTGQWEDVEISLDPDPAKWVWGKGENGYFYDTFLSLPESLKTIHNLHLPVLRPDDQNIPPSGSFEMDDFEIVFNRNGPRPGDPIDLPSGVVFDPPLNAASTGNSGLSFRGITSPIPKGGTQIRLTFKASPNGPSSASHVAVGVSASGSQTVGAPVELKFNGAAGYSLPAGQEITSDWADLNTVAGNVLVPIIDSTSSEQARTSVDYAGGCYFSTGQSYNAASPAGQWSHFGKFIGGKIEVR